MRLNVDRSDATADLRTREIAEQLHVPYSYAAKAVATLNQMGVIDARRGRTGGLRITDLGRGASIGWLVRNLEGEDEVIDCEGANPCPLRNGCRLRSALRHAQEAFFAALDPITVADISEEPSRAILLSLVTAH